MLANAGLLYGLGIGAKPDRTTMTFAGADGATEKVELPALPVAKLASLVQVREKSANPTPLTWQHRDKPYWFEQLPDSKTVFFQYNQVTNAPDEMFSVFCKRLFAYIDEHDIDRLVVDMRWNGGGNNFLNAPLLDGLIRSRINAPGKLFVIVGRNTFSAAMCGAVQIERYTNAIFAGEPTGSSPNFIGESVPFTLPYSKMTGTFSDLYWQNSVAMDRRTWIPTTIYVPSRFSDYAANRDAVLDAVLAYHAGS